jgi:integrase
LSCREKISGGRPYFLDSPNKLLKEGKLVPEKAAGVPTLREWTADFWDMEKSEYLKSRRGRGTITVSYVKNAKNCTDRQILPYLGDLRLNAITEEEVENWLTGFEDRGLSKGTANSAHKKLSLMLKYACKKKVIKSNPCVLVEKLQDKGKEIEILTPEEVMAMFSARWSDVWDDYISYGVNKLAACTGMRIGEVLGLRSECVHEGYLEVCMQYTDVAGYTDVKTHKPRNIPIHEGIEKELRELIKVNGEGFVFVKQPQNKKPIRRNTVAQIFFKALETIGINEARRKQRNLTFHSWRHFFNTYLLTANVADAKVMAVTGHVTEKMKKHYTHFDTTQFTEVTEAQKSLLERRGGRKTRSGKTKQTKGVRVLIARKIRAK